MVEIQTVLNRLSANGICYFACEKCGGTAFTVVGKGQGKDSVLALLKSNNICKVSGDESIKVLCKECSKSEF